MKVKRTILLILSLIASTILQGCNKKRSTPASAPLASRKVKRVDLSDYYFATSGGLVRLRSESGNMIFENQYRKTGEKVIVAARTIVKGAQPLSSYKEYEVGADAIEITYFKSSFIEEEKRKVIAPRFVGVDDSLPSGDVVKSLDDTVKTPVGEFKSCIRAEYKSSTDSSTKYWCKGYGEVLLKRDSIDGKSSIAAFDIAGLPKLVTPVAAVESKSNTSVQSSSHSPSSAPGYAWYLIVDGSKNESEARSKLKKWRSVEAKICHGKPCLTLAFSSDYPDMNPGYHIVVAGSFTDKKVADAAMKAARKTAKDAYLRKSRPPSASVAH